MAQAFHYARNPGSTRAFSVSSTLHGDTHHVMVDGELDMATEPQLATCLDALDGQIVLECDELRFIDSRGISLLVKTHQRLEANGGRLVISGLVPNCRRPIELMHLESVLHLAN
jgi:anti-sigma B factor antagonist